MLSKYDFGEYESQGEKFYYIETGIETDTCQRRGNYIIGNGEVLYYKTEAEYESGDPSTIPFRFEWCTLTDRIEIYECEYDKDIDTEELLDNLKTNILPEMKEN